MDDERSSDEKWPLRISTTAVVAVAGVAAAVSYSHMYEVAAVAGEQWRAYALPISVDGLVIAATLNAWRAKRAGESVAGWTVAALAIGLLVSIAANVAAPFLMHGPASGPLSAVVAAWPPIALALSFEELARMRRASREVSAPVGTVSEVPEQPAPRSAEPMPGRHELEGEPAQAASEGGTVPAGVPDRHGDDLERAGVDDLATGEGGTDAGTAETMPAQDEGSVPAPARERARQLVRDEPAAWTGAGLAAEFGMSERWGRKQRAAVQQERKQQESGPDRPALAVVGKET